MFLKEMQLLFVLGFSVDSSKSGEQISSGTDVLFMFPLCAAAVLLCCPITHPQSKKTTNKSLLGKHLP